MNSMLILCIFALVGLSIADTDLHPRGCIYINGRCFSECEEGTHGYTTGCGVLTPEATCDNPKPEPDARGGLLCDYSACYCDAPTVRDTKTNKCIPVEECPKKE